MVEPCYWGRPIPICEASWSICLFAEAPTAAPTICRSYKSHWCIWPVVSTADPQYSPAWFCQSCRYPLLNWTTPLYYQVTRSLTNVTANANQILSEPTPELWRDPLVDHALPGSRLYLMVWPALTEVIEKVQKRATKLVIQLKKLCTQNDLKNWIFIFKV